MSETKDALFTYITFDRRKAWTACEDGATWFEEAK